MHPILQNLARIRIVLQEADAVLKQVENAGERLCALDAKPITQPKLPRKTATRKPRNK